MFYKNSARKNARIEKRGNTAERHEKKNGIKRKNTRRSFTALTNLAMALILFSAGAACLYDGGGAVTAEGENNVFRRGEADSNGVSLMFNVYENTPVVYEILQILSDEGAKATFFVGGCWADDNEKCLNAIKDRGTRNGKSRLFS